MIERRRATARYGREGRRDIHDPGRMGSDEHASSRCKGARAHAALPALRARRAPPRAARRRHLCRPEYRAILAHRVNDERVLVQIHSGVQHIGTFDEVPDEIQPRQSLGGSINNLYLTSATSKAILALRCRASRISVLASSAIRASCEPSRSVDAAEGAHRSSRGYNSSRAPSQTRRR